LGGRGGRGGGASAIRERGKASMGVATE